jgi:hypothetical protein
MFLGAAAAILTTRALPGWLGWLAGLAGLLLLISLFTVFSDDFEGPLEFVAFGGYLLMLVWVLATSIMLLLRPGGDPFDEPGQMRSADTRAA